MAETDQHYSPSAQVMDGLPDEDDFDWRNIDRLIILLSLTITERVLRRRQTTMPEDVKSRVLDRMKDLIAVYKRPNRKR